MTFVFAVILNAVKDPEELNQPLPPEPFCLKVQPGSLSFITSAVPRTRTAFLNPAPNPVLKSSNTLRKYKEEPK
ncbi:hypothetical protein RBB79_07465 [Tunturiibacter empetritectus]|uniref:Uncharacterized protein n=2 Tax=Tunturiibacter TaxID=3154218 RepID=A0A852VGL4_9BACT|nr:hypothetical protein [Edaphobacter lichenicola]NYF89375.1 hypothetical protein [Edaphobacter lichenicola]